MIFGERELFRRKDILKYTPWRSTKSVDRAEKEGFPFEIIDGIKMYDPKKVLAWFKARHVQVPKTA